MSESSRSLRVFISYARSDASAFAEELMAGLEAAGFDPFLDRHDISAGEDWEVRLLNLLQQADTVVYVLTPASVHSERCAWEIGRAMSLSKRLIPVVAIDVLEAETPEPLRRLNYIFFSEGHSFGAGLRELSTALRTDLPWVREHTRLGELASRWVEHSRPEELLLRGSELDAAKGWLAAWKAGAPEPTSVHREFINESESAERVRDSAERRRLEEVARVQADREQALTRLKRNTELWLWSVVALAVVLGAFGFFLLSARRELADTRQRLADRDANLADVQQQLVEKQEAVARAVDNLRNATANTQAAQPTRPPSSSSASPTVQPAAPPSSAAGPDVAIRAETQDLLRQARIDLGWDIDVFWCEGPGGAQNKAHGQTVVDLLTAERTRQGTPGANGGGIGFGLGRIRLRPLGVDVNARDGYQVHTDVIRAEESEARQADALRSFVAGRQGPTLSSMRSGMKTAYYLSVFLCAAS